jgi:hypothetical protein
MCPLDMSVGRWVVCGRTRVGGESGVRRDVLGGRQSREGVEKVAFCRVKGRQDLGSVGFGSKATGFWWVRGVAGARGSKVAYPYSLCCVLCAPTNP